MYLSTSELYPLPIAHEKRTSPCDFIPDVADESGHASIIWNLMCRMRLGVGRFSGAVFSDFALDWQKKLVYAIYGPVDFNRKRIVSEAFLTIAKKNGKTQFASLLALAHALAFPRQDARIVLVAATKEQAQLLYAPIKSAIEQDSDLLKLCNVRVYKQDVVIYETQTVIKCVSPDLHSTVGEAPEFFIVDELHLLGQKRHGASMARQLASGLSVTDGVGVYITTAPLAGEVGAGIYQQMYARAQRVLNGESKNERLLPVMFELPQNHDPQDSSKWWMPNPSLDKTVTQEWLLQQYDIALSSPDQTVITDFYAQHLNLRVVNHSVSSDTWSIAKVWGDYADHTITLDRVMKCEQVFAGIDAGGQDDMTGLVLIGIEGDKKLVWSKAWLTVDGYSAYSTNTQLYDDFIREGWLELIDEPGQDVAAIAEILVSCENLLQIGVDPYGLQDLIREAEKIAPVAAVHQGFRISPYIEGVEREVFSGSFKHHGSKCLSWCIGNAVIETKGLSKTLKKPWAAHSGAKIDLAMCLVFAYAAQQVAEVFASSYDNDFVM